MYKNTVSLMKMNIPILLKDLSGVKKIMEISK